MKRNQIKIAEDPAIRSPLPAFKDPLHVGRPNIGNRETFIQFVNEIFDQHWLTNNGPLVQPFEHRIADYLGVKRCVAMNNGTIALEIAIRALGMNGEVIVPSYTFIALPTHCNGKESRQYSRTSTPRRIIWIRQPCDG